MPPTFALFKAKSICRFFNRYHAATPTTRPAPTAQPEKTACRNLLYAIREDTTAQKSTISFRTVSGLNSMPTGYCIQALAIRIQNADRVAPRNTNHVEARCIFLLTLFQPKNMMEINVASIKKAKIPSMARGAPKISPTNQL